MSADPRRRIPGVDRLLEAPGATDLIARWGRERTTAALRAAVERVRSELAAGSEADGDALADATRYLATARAQLEADDVPSLRPVINATGVVLHTNLGRAPLADEARAAMERAARGYSNLEFDLEAGERGSRYAHGRTLLAELTHAADALVVNNCAAALVLAVNTLAAGRDVVVSRGELVEIGGGFRIPDMLLRAGARLAEVGSTNRTRVSDYRQALDEADVGLVLKVHRSNFRLEGFTEEATLDELVALGREAGVPVLHDVGSGLLVDPDALGLPDEPTAARSMRTGATLAVFSGDKLLGGPQAGCVVGDAEVIGRLRRNPLCRAFRVDKATLAALEATLRLYRDPASALERVPVLGMLRAPAEAVRARAEALVEAFASAGVDAEAAPGDAVVGGGTFPGHRIASWTVRVGAQAGRSADEIARALRVGEPAVVARVDDGTVVLHPRTVAPGDEAALVAAVVAAVAPATAPGDAP